MYFSWRPAARLPEGRMGSVTANKFEQVQGGRGQGKDGRDKDWLKSKRPNCTFLTHIYIRQVLVDPFKYN